MKYHHLPLLVVACLVIQVQLQIVNNHEYSHIYEECPPIECIDNADCSDLEDSKCESIEVPTEDPTTFETTEAPPRRCQCPLEFIRECQSENPPKGKCIPYPDTVENSTCYIEDHCKKVAVDGNPDWVTCNTTSNACQCTESAFRVQDPYPVQDAIHDKCIANISTIEEPCKIDEQCQILLNDAECFQNPPAPPQPPTWKCRCTGGPDKSYLHPTLQKCFKYAERVGDKCEHVEQCIKYIQEDGEDSGTVECRGVSPLEKTCQCKEDALTIDDHCWKVITDGTTPCKIPEQCYSNANATCNDSTLRCDCTTGFVDIDHPSTNISCKPVVTEENARCESSFQCIKGMGEYAVCEESFCKCNGTSKYYDAEGQSKCFIPKFMNQLCSAPEECMVGVGNNSRCRNDTGRCDCLTTAIDWEGGCYLSKIVGDSCARHEECRVPINGKVKCDERDKRCVCEVDNVPDFGGKVCRSGSGRNNGMEINFLAVAIFAIVKFLFKT